MNTSSSTADAASRGVSRVARDGKVLEESHIEILRLRDTRARERQSIRTMESLTEGLGLSMTRVHVEGKSAESTVVVAVDVPEERTARALLVRSRSMGDHTSVDILSAALETPNIIVDEALGRVKLGAGLAINVEDIRALDG